ncbi:Hypothetical predicted protein [Mytilus galloprovincialis]|uniref:Uncharacterized protein n=1 Tax=Mytilus galloprovincialis TaxID=29158 RepID=A0A8B6E1L9_MYTGA|nr:Hypothetical predicted protein [Mytilus galloprovincialis]
MKGHHLESFKVLAEKVPPCLVFHEFCRRTADVLGSIDDFQLVNKTFDDENEVIIEGRFPKDYKCEAVPWHSEDKIAMIGNDVFPVGFKFETDVFYINEIKTGLPIDVNKIPAENVFIKTPLFNKDVRDEMYFQYRGAVQYADIWKLVEPLSKGGYIVFDVDAIESFCVISFFPEQKCKIFPAGGQFGSTADDRVQVNFPPNAVIKSDDILFKVHPVDVNCITEIPREDDSAVPISAITPSISANHMTFERLIEIQLPVQCIPGAHVDEDSYKYTVFRWEKDGSLQLSGIDPLFTNGILSFETSSFSGFIGASGSKSSSVASIKYAVEEAMGLRKWCKILFFVGKKQNNRIKVILQCVEIQKVSVMCDLRKQSGFHFFADCMSSNLFLPPDTTVIDVDIKGRFSLPKASAIRHHKVRFIPSGGDIFTELQVELRAYLSGELYGILVLRHGKDSAANIL